MRFLCPLARMLSLFLLSALFPSAVSADSAPTPTGPTRRVRIQCTFLRARITDVDAFGINFDLAPPKPYLSALNMSPSNARIARGTYMTKMLRDLTDTRNPLHYSAFAAPTLMSDDGQSGIVSLKDFSDPGLTKTPWLVVISHVHDDGTISFYVSPQFRFVRVPGTKDDPPAASIDGFPVTITVPNGDTIVLNEESRPAPLPTQPASTDSPFIGKYFAHHVRNVGTTELWVFLTATVLPETPTPTSPMELTRHA